MVRPEGGSFAGRDVRSRRSPCGRPVDCPGVLRCLSNAAFGLSTFAPFTLAATVATATPPIAAEVRLEGDALQFEIAGPDGRTERVDLEGLRAKFGPPPPRPALERVLNVDGPVGVAWVVFGLAAQALFAGRMVVQWLVSERRGESTVPVVFWWLSLGGSSMLVAYFAWRGDPVGILGQGLGLFIYVRNLVLIRRSAIRASVAAAEAT